MQVAFSSQPIFQPHPPQSTNQLELLLDLQDYIIDLLRAYADIGERFDRLVDDQKTKAIINKVAPKTPSSNNATAGTSPSAVAAAAAQQEKRAELLLQRKFAVHCIQEETRYLYSHLFTVLVLFPKQLTRIHEQHCKHLASIWHHLAPVLDVAISRRVHLPVDSDSPIAFSSAADETAPLASNYSAQAAVEIMQDSADTTATTANDSKPVLDKSNPFYDDD